MERQHEESLEAAESGAFGTTISRLLREQFPLVETYCNAATRLANAGQTSDQSDWLPSTQAFLHALQRVQRHVAQMETLVQSLRSRVEGERDTVVVTAVEEHYERLRRILTSIFTHNASFNGLDGFVPSPTRDGDVDVRLIALSTLRASIQKTQKLIAA